MTILKAKEVGSLIAEQYNQAIARPVQPIHQLMEELDSSLNLLAERLVQLDARLDPIRCQSEVAQEKEKSNGPRLAGSHLGARLESFIFRIRTNIEHVSDLHDSLEI